MKLTFVTPRYGREVVGGAEAGARALASRMAGDGWDVSVLTSCAVDARTWADHYAPGPDDVEGVRVNRFPVARTRDPDFDRRSAAILGAPETVDDASALDWIDRQGPDCPALLDAVEAVDDGVLVMYPYLFQPTVRGVTRARVPVVLHPAAHPELPLRLPVFAEVFGAVQGLGFHTAAEQRVVAERFPVTHPTPQVIMRLPVDEPEGDPHATRIALDLGDEPFVLYLGRIDRGKGTDELVRRFAAFRAARGRGQLVLAGPVVHPPPDAVGVRVLGVVSEEHKAGLLRAADVLVNPSPLESFSLVINEAWLAGTPVLVNGWCPPMVEQCLESGGGLWWTGIADFDEALGRLLDDAGLRARLAAHGRAYTRRTTAWPAVRRRYEALLSRL